MDIHLSFWIDFLPIQIINVPKAHQSIHGTGGNVFPLSALFQAVYTKISMLPNNAHKTMRVKMHSPGKQAKFHKWKTSKQK